MSKGYNATLDALLCATNTMCHVGMWHASMSNGMSCPAQSNDDHAAVGATF